MRVRSAAFPSGSHGWRCSNRGLFLQEPTVNPNSGLTVATLTLSVDGDTFEFAREALMALKAGDRAPDFKLASMTGETQGEFQLSAEKRKNTVICFYALDFTPV